MKKSPDPVRIGVLGCGMISQAAHFESCQKAKNARLYAICDAADDLRNRMAQIWEPEVAYSKYEEMLADPKVEGVIIGIADQFHVPTAAQAINAGKHVLVEKPLGVNVEECVDLLRLKQTAPNLIFRVGSMKRFDPGVAFARRFIDQEMGARLAIKAWYCDSTSRYTETANVQPLVAQSASAKRPPAPARTAPSEPLCAMGPSMTAPITHATQGSWIARSTTVNSSQLRFAA